MSKLRTLEAVDRLGSFTRAAIELNMTQAAVSYQIRMLEEELGVRLISRTGKGTGATEPGRSFLSDICEPLKKIEAATARIRKRNPTSGALRILVMQAFATLWLLPRLPRFKAAHPRIDIKVLSQVGGVSRITEADFDKQEIDVTVIYTGKPRGWKGVFTEQLVQDYALPVCSPDLLDSTRKKGDLSGLISDCTILHAINWPEIWPRWLKEAGMSDITPHNEIHLQHTAMTVQAAAAGMGVAMAHGPLVQEELATGRLVAPFERAMRMSEGYYFACPRNVEQIGAVASFRTWLRREMTRGGLYFIAGNPGSGLRVR